MQNASAVRETSIAGLAPPRRARNRRNPKGDQDFYHGLLERCRGLRLGMPGQISEAYVLTEKH